MSILMGSDNPDGYKLEELLSTLIEEIQLKSDKISDDESVIAKTVLNNNGQIMGLLTQAKHIQKQSYVLLDNKGENKGPKGFPRIGTITNMEEGLLYGAIVTGYPYDDDHSIVEVTVFGLNPDGVPKVIVFPGKGEENPPFLNQAISVFLSDNKLFYNTEESDIDG